MRATYTRGRAILNGSVSAAQVVVVSATLLLSYQLAVSRTGEQDFGLYSLFFTLAMLSQVGSLGFGSGAAKHVASSWGRGRHDEVRPLIRLSLLVSLLGGLAAAGVLFWVLGIYMDSFLGSDQRALAEALRPAVLCAAALLPLSTAVQGLMDGASRSYVRGPVVMMGALAYLASAWSLLPAHGVVALAFASIIQLALVISVLTTYLFVITRGSSAPWLPTRAVAQSVFRYNMKLHILTLPTLAFDPLVKLLLGGFAGLAAVAYFEIANRLLQQVNALILAANQAVVPLVAVREATGDLVPAEAFRRMFRIVLVLAVGCFAGAVLVLPVLGRFVFGEEGDAVVGFGAVLAVGWVSMGTAGPAYFIGVTIDNLRVNLVANYGALLMIALLGSALGFLGGALGVAAGVSIAYVFAGSLVSGQFLRRYHVSVRDLVTPRQWVTTAACVAIVALALVGGQGKNLSSVVAITTLSLAVVAALALVELAPVLRSILGPARGAKA